MSRQTVAVVCSDEVTRAMSAEVEKELALHRGVGQHKSKWAITHIPTGRKIVSFYMRSMALGCMIELAYSTDWNVIDNSKKNQKRLMSIIKPIIERWRYIEASVRGMD